MLGYFNLHVWHQLFYQYTEYRNKELRGIKFRTFNCSPLNKNIPQNRLQPGLAQAGSRFFFPETGHLLIWNTMSWFDCLYSTQNLQKHQSFHWRTIEVWNLISIFVFLLLAWIFLVYEAFVNSFWIKYGKRQGHTNPKVQAWGNVPVQDVRCHGSCCCFVNFNALIFFICMYPQLWLCLRAERIFPSRQNNNMIPWISTSPWFMMLFCRFSIPEFFHLHVPDTAACLGKLPWQAGSLSASE